MTHIIAILNQKGGVGKTTTAINLSAYLAKEGHSVLLVDLDPQGNATSGLGITKQENEHGSYEVLLARAPLHVVVRETPYEQLYVMPTDSQLAAAEVELVSMDRR